MLLVFERRQRRDLRQPIHIERLPGFLQDLNELRMRQSITDTQTCEAVDFRKCAQNEEIATVTKMAGRIGRRIEEFEIRFVQNHYDIVRKANQKLLELILGKQNPSR